MPAAPVSRISSGASFGRPAPLTVRETVEGVMAVWELPAGDREAFVAAREGVRYALRMHRAHLVEDGSTPRRWNVAP